MRPKVLPVLLLFMAATICIAQGSSRDQYTFLIHVDHFVAASAGAQVVAGSGAAEATTESDSHFEIAFAHNSPKAYTLVNNVEWPEGTTPAELTVEAFRNSTVTGVGQASEQLEGMVAGGGQGLTGGVNGLTIGALPAGRWSLQWSIENRDTVQWDSPNSPLVITSTFIELP